MIKAKFQVPKHIISWIVGRVRVITPDSEVEADIRRRCSALTPAQRNACVKYALKCHRNNQELFNRYGF